jgi:hypothetical protein
MVELHTYDGGHVAEGGRGWNQPPYQCEHILYTGTCTCCHGVSSGDLESAAGESRPQNREDHAIAAPRSQRACDGQHARHHALQMRLLRLSLPGPLACRIVSSDQRVRRPLLNQLLDVPVGRDMHRSMRDAPLSNPCTHLVHLLSHPEHPLLHYYHLALSILVSLQCGCSILQTYRALLSSAFHLAGTWPQHFLLSSR